MSRFLLFSLVAMTSSLAWLGKASAQTNSTIGTGVPTNPSTIGTVGLMNSSGNLSNTNSFPTPIPTGNAFFNNFYQNMARANVAPLPGMAAPGTTGLNNAKPITPFSTLIPNPNDQKNNFTGYYSSLANSNNHVVYHTLESLERSVRQGDWQNRYQRNFPHAIYNYDAWTQPGSVKNNPLSLYGPASNVPTLFNPNYVTGGPYKYKVVPFSSPNPMAPPRYNVVPLPPR